MEYFINKNASNGQLLLDIFSINYQITFRYTRFFKNKDQISQFARLIAFNQA